MKQNVPAREIVDRQLRAYNARDIDAYCKLFAADAFITRIGETQDRARGIDAIRAYYVRRFENPRLHCRVKSRMELQDFVIDHEEVAGVTDRLLEVIAIYEVRDSLIRSLRLLWP